MNLVTNKAHTVKDALLLSWRHVCYWQKISQSHGIFARNISSGNSRDSQNLTGYCYCPWLPPRGRRRVPVAENTMPFSTA